MGCLGDFSGEHRLRREAFQIPGAAHCALEYQRWAVRSQLRGEGYRFMRSMTRPLGVPVLHMRGDTDPYVLAASVERTRRYAPTAASYHSPAPGISATRSARSGQRSPRTVPQPGLRALGRQAGPRRHRLGVVHLGQLPDTSLAVSTKPVSLSSTAAPNTTPST